ncbi:MAG: hypothetical protein ACI81A_001728, partial [Paraglaciecola sp.]
LSKIPMILSRRVRHPLSVIPLNIRTATNQQYVFITFSHCLLLS